MANTFRIKRRVTGSPGAPGSLTNGELAFNEVDNTLYYGKGIASGITAASVISIGGPGLLANYVDLTTNQTIAGTKTFSGTLQAPTVLTSDNSTNVATTAWVRGFAQPLSTSLTTLDTFTGNASVGFVVKTAAGTLTTRSVTGTVGRIGITNPDGVSGNTVIDLLSSGVTAGTYTKVTVDTYGRVTTGANASNADIVASLGFTPENIANKGVANGYAGLDSGGKVPLAQLPSTVAGAMNYQGTWNASTNTPALTSGTGTKGFFYKVSTAGSTSIDGNSNWTVGDIIAYNGTAWDKLEGGGSDVSSVAGKVGAVTLVAADIGGLGTLATQNASAVNITGGTISASTISGNISGNAVNVTGTVAVANGGTGATSLTGYVKGNGTAAMTASATIPATDITGLGTMSAQNASAVAITGGTVDGIVLDGGTF